MAQKFLNEYQPLVFAQIKRSIKHERLAHAYLFEGESGCGKHELSIWLAKRLLCTNLQDDEPCNQCNNCLRIDQNEHPDVLMIKPDGQMIKVEQIRNLQAEFSKSGFESNQKIFIISQADKMNPSAANSLLKFLEEPIGNFLAILETDAIGKMLPTIQSRCQIIHFLPLSKEKLQEKLQNEGISKETSALLTSLTNSYDKAVEISQNEWFNESKKAVSQWATYLLEKNSQAFIYVQKKLLGLAKEKEQQQMIFSILLFFLRKERMQAAASEALEIELNQMVALTLAAQKKLMSNVAFQGTAEQLAVKIVYGF